MDNLTGKWSNGAFSLVIKKDRYVSFCGGLRYGKGTIIYDNGSFSLTSTHASWFFFLWTPFTERVKGKYSITGNDELTISDVEGRYSFLNGTWIRRK